MGCGSLEWDHLARGEQALVDLDGQVIGVQRLVRAAGLGRVARHADELTVVAQHRLHHGADGIVVGELQEIWAPVPEVLDVHHLHVVARAPAGGRGVSEVGGERWGGAARPQGSRWVAGAM